MQILRKVKPIFSKTLCKECVVIIIIQSHDKKRINLKTSFSYRDAFGI